MTIDWNTFAELTQIPGAPAFEHEVRKAMKAHLTKYTEEIIQDRLGGIYGVKRGTDSHPKVLVAGHMDEVAFMVTKITPEGFLRFQTLGGWWSQVLLSQRVDVITRTGKRISGVIGSIPPHLLDDERKNKTTDISQMFIDVGASSEEEVKAWGIRPGDSAVPHFPFVEMEGGRRIMSKAWDNRFGCGAVIEVLRALQDEEHPNTVYLGATTQEEVGLRGASAAVGLIKPDIFIALDAGPAGDIPGVKNGFGKIGKGALIRLFDRSMITLPKMKEFILDTAETEKIPYQYFVSQGGTDAGRVHIMEAGIPSAAIGICARYIHSHASIADKEDIEAAIRLTTALIKRLDRSTFETIIS